MHLHAKKRSRSSRGQCGVSMRDGRNGRIGSVEFFHRGFRSFGDGFWSGKKYYVLTRIYIVLNSYMKSHFYLKQLC
jgi:hypothetical protein